VPDLEFDSLYHKNQNETKRLAIMKGINSFHGLFGFGGTGV
jgi:hypothetical protein